MGGKRWTEEEVSVLRDIGNRRRALITQMHLLPGRNWESAKAHAAKLRISLAGPEAWTPEEIAILKRIYRSKFSIKSQVASLLPNRGYSAARLVAIRLGFAGKGNCNTGGRTGYSWILPAMEKALEDHGGLTAKGLAIKTGASIQSVNYLIRTHRNRFHVEGWNGVGNHICPRWARGNKADVPKPPRKTAQDHVRAKRQRERVRAGRFDPFATLIQQVAA